MIKCGRLAVPLKIYKNLDFGVINNSNLYVTLKVQGYKSILVPEGFIFDGVTVKAPFTFLFSNKNLRCGIKASCFHDYMCQNKEKYKRKEASEVLRDLWKGAGLSPWKANFVYLCVEFFQWCKGWK